MEPKKYTNESSDIEKEEKVMKLFDKGEEIEYILKFFKEEDHIHFIVKESNVYVPFTFEASFTLDDIIQRHISFKSCDNLDEVIMHLNNLYDNNKISIQNLGDTSERYLYLKAWDISKEFESEYFNLIILMTDEKDKALFDLYEIQKKQMKLIQDIQLIVQKNLPKESPLNKNICSIIENPNAN